MLNRKYLVPVAEIERYQRMGEYSAPMDDDECNFKNPIALVIKDWFRLYKENNLVAEFTIDDWAVNHFAFICRPLFKLDEYWDYLLMPDNIAKPQ